MSFLSSKENGTIINLIIRPSSRSQEIVGPFGEPPRLKIKVCSAPEKGKANKELLKFLKKLLGIPSSRLQLIRGHTSSEKDVLAIGLSPEEVRIKLWDN